MTPPPDRLAMWALIVALVIPVSLKFGPTLPETLAQAVLQYWQVIAAALAGYIGRGALERDERDKHECQSTREQPLAPQQTFDGEGDG